VVHGFSLHTELEQLVGADLVVLDADPLTDIRNTRRIHAVIADGRVYGESERAAALQFVEEQAHRVSVICRFLRGIWFDG
jgi:hypothetical protein